jgi:hypothetical protein
MILPTTHPEQTLKANVMACKPEWTLSGPDVSPKVNLHPPQGQITINVPEGFESLLNAVENAALLWQNALGVSITVVQNEPCPPTGGRCITFTDDHPLDDEDSCASQAVVGSEHTYNPVNGEWTGVVNIRLRSDWEETEPNRQKRRISHELGHFFGLGNREHSSCGFNSSVMKTVPGMDCHDEVPPNTVLGPSQSDIDALKKSTYSNQNRVVCGW